MEIDQKIFRAYDIRGFYPDQINKEVAYKIGRAYVERTGGKNLVVGRDLRQSSEELMTELIRGLIDAGAKVTSVGEISNDMLVFAITNYGFDGGIVLSASHNPIGYAGFKMMFSDGTTLPGEDKKFVELVNQTEFLAGEIAEAIPEKNIFSDYQNFVFSFIDKTKLKNQKILFDPLFGSVNLILKDLLFGLPVQPIFLHDKADKNFGGLSEPNPLNQKISAEASELARKSTIDFGVTWDGDGDRVFFFDENGNFIPAPYITAILVEDLLKKNPGAKIVIDTRIIWPIEKAVNENRGQLFETRCGYRFLKEKMVEIDSPFGVEMTAHYLYKKNHFCDNGIIPFLQIWQFLSETDSKLSELVTKYKENHFMIDEIAFKFEDAEPILAKIKNEYSNFEISEIDGVTVISDQFRFNLRPSNTEPILKLNMEAKSQEILDQEKEKIINLIEK